MTGEKLTIDGLDIEIVPYETADRAAYVVCVPWSTPAIFHDDIRGTCVACGVTVRFRPYMPKTPPRICVECALGLARKQ
jgi:hypothetical protein